MIISLSGKMGSGKDTVGNIIHYLLDNKNLDGNQGFNPDYNYAIGFSKFKTKKFADKLKEIACMLIGCTREQLEDQEFKKSFLYLEWGYWQTSNIFKQMTVREFLQKLGTNAMRNGLHENVWVNALMCDYKPESYKRIDVVYTASSLPNWIITDTRFPNELEAVKKHDGITIKITRPNCVTADLHPSETALDDVKFDYEIINDGTIQDLVLKVKEVLKQIDLL